MLAPLLALQYPARHLALDRLGLRRLQAPSGQIPRLRGRGMTFEEHRSYQPGDEPRFIDWRVTARTGQMHIKIFREEHERPVVLVLDVRPQMRFGSRHQFKSRLASEACALLGWSAAHARERVGGIVLGERLAEVPVRAGVHGMLPWLQRAAHGMAAPDGTTAGAPADLALALRHLRRTLRPGSIVVMASDFADLDDALSAQLVDVTRHGQLILLPISDPLEMAPPERGQFPLRHGSAVRWIDFGDTRQRTHWRHRFERRAEQVQRVASAARAICLPLATPLAALEQLSPHLSRSP